MSDLSRIHLLSLRQEARLIAACSPVLAPVVEFALHTGLEPHECQLADWSWVRWDPPELTLPETVTRTRRARHIPLDGAAVRVLQPLAEGGTEGAIFLNTQGTPYHHEDLQKRFHDAARRAGLHNITWSSLRETFAARVVKAGLDAERYAAMLGRQPLAHPVWHAPVRLPAETMAVVRRPDETGAEAEREFPRALYPRDRHPAIAYLSTLSKISREGMLYRLEFAARLFSGGRLEALGFPWDRLRYTHVLAMRAKLADLGKAPSTCNTTLYAVRGVLKQAWLLGYLPHEEYARIQTVSAVRGGRLPKGRALEPGEVATLFESCLADPRQALGARDAALVAILYGLGFRVAEAASLDLTNYDVSSGAVTVIGKGNKERRVYALGPTAQVLKEWLAIRGTWPGPLLTHVRQHGRIKPDRLTRRSLSELIRRRAQLAGVAHFTPHDGRRSFITAMLDAGVDLLVVQRLAGHSDVNTTARYDRRGERAQLAAMPRLPMPYPGRPEGVPLKEPVTTDRRPASPPEPEGRPGHAAAPRRKATGRSWEDLSPAEQEAIRARLRDRLPRR